MTDSRFLGRVNIGAALELQENFWRERRECLLGFESEPVITLGLRGRDGADLVLNRDVLTERGFQILSVDRGGQATLHNPGQLVIFPVCDVRRFGARGWIELLSQVTVETLRAFGVESAWRADCPGVYTSRGKIMSCGVRIRQGMSTHGIAINVCNDLNAFALIRACGVSGAAVDSIGEGFSPSAVFTRWCETFNSLS